MLVAFTCHDKPNSVDLRMKTRPAHLAWLEKNKDKVTFAGPLLHDDGQTPRGSLIVAEFESLEAARAFQKADPYTQAGLFAEVIVMPTRKVFPAA
jgi:uncharacterized protein